jgi:hypothetical protein
MNHVVPGQEDQNPMMIPKKKVTTGKKEPLVHAENQSETGLILLKRKKKPDPVDYCKDKE